MHFNKNPSTHDKMKRFERERKKKKNEHIHWNERTVSRSMFEGGSDPHDA